MSARYTEAQNETLATLVAEHPDSWVDPISTPGIDVMYVRVTHRPIGHTYFTVNPDGTYID